MAEEENIEKHDHHDLRGQAVEAVTNYMYHRMFDRIPNPQMIIWLREQANVIVGCADTAIEKTFVEGKKKGLL